MAEAIATLRIEMSPELMGAVEAITGAIECVGESLPAEFLELCDDLVESRKPFDDAIFSDNEGVPTERAGDSCLVLKASEPLLELAAAARALKLDFSLKHGAAP